MNNQLIDFNAPCWVFFESYLKEQIDKDREKLEGINESEVEARVLTRGRIRAYRDVFRWKQTFEKEQQNRR